MTTFFLDPDGGNDANSGTTFANRWKTLTSGATAARIAPGDEIRVMASPDPESVGNATWTYNSRTVTLAAAKTLTITDCDAAWTVSANVTGSNPGGASGQNKTGTASQQLAVAAAFTTGKIAYVATGALNLSAYERVSLLVQSSLALASGVLQLKLCTDTVGDVPAHTLNLPAITAGNPNTWQAVVLDNGGAMNSAIQSVALYATVDPGATTIRLDNIVAALSATTSGALTHNSLLGKVHALGWQASTAYGVNTIRIPTPTNRTGFCYKVTATSGAGQSGASEPSWPLEIGDTVTDGDLTWTRQDEEESWYAITGLLGTTVLLEAWNSAHPAQGQGYCGPTGSETVATYKRECFLTVPETAFSTSVDAWLMSESGTNADRFTLSGGWNRTDMSTQEANGQTWFNGQNGWGAAITAPSSRTGWIFKNINSVKFSAGLTFASSASGRVEFYNSHFNNNTNAGLNVDNNTGYLKMRNVQANCNGAQGFDTHGQFAELFAIAANGNSGIGSGSCGVEVSGDVRINHIFTRKTAGIALAAGNNGQSDIAVRNWLSTGSTTQAITWSAPSDRIRYDLFNCDLTGETTIAPVGLFSTLGRTHGIYSTRHNRVADSHLIITAGGSIESATDQRNTASGISWKFKPTVGGNNSTARDRTNPLRLSIAKIACAAGAAVYVRVYVRRDNANIYGRMVVEGGTLRGVPDDVVTADIAPALDTWVQSDPLTFTPTEAGVAEVFFECWDGSAATTTSQMWIDDISVSSS